MIALGFSDVAQGQGVHGVLWRDGVLIEGCTQIRST
jgi:hypothetical protein